jgi:hypothetical protein
VARHRKGKSTAVEETKDSEDEDKDDMDEDWVLSLPFSSSFWCLLLKEEKISG